MTTPATLADAEERRQQLTLEIQGIQAQLGDKQRTDEAGRRLNAQEYWAWKKKAQYALNLKLDELRTLKSWIKDNRPAFDGPRAEVDRSVVDHLEDLYVILRNLQEDDVDLDPAEISKIDAAQKALIRFGSRRQKELYAGGGTPQ